MILEALVRITGGPFSTKGRLLGVRERMGGSFTLTTEMREVATELVASPSLTVMVTVRVPGVGSVAVFL